ncbi:MAG: cytochrome c, partial [Nitrospirota bacterium]
GSEMRRVGIGRIIAGGALLFLVGCGGGEGEIKPPPPVPAAYADKHMPDGWWTDPAVIAEGKEIYEGKKDIDVNCSSCHGVDGKPKKRGARDFRVAERMKLYSDSTLFWRISEGVPKTKMKSWKKKLTEEDIWKVTAYLHRFSHGGNPAPHDDYTSGAQQPPQAS